MRSDIYSLGLSLYELLAFRPAYDEHERNRLIRQVTTEEPRAAGPGEPAGSAGPGDDRQQGDRARSRASLLILRRAGGRPPAFPGR